HPDSAELLKIRADLVDTESGSIGNIAGFNRRAVVRALPLPDDGDDMCNDGFTHKPELLFVCK
ncbi:hypothetical protein SEE8A_003274, partial [Salmonella enterica subsp. enterica serovar Enteritidis str. SE8a]